MAGGNILNRARTLTIIFFHIINSVTALMMRYNIGWIMLLEIKMY